MKRLIIAVLIAAAVAVAGSGLYLQRQLKARGLPHTRPIEIPQGMGARDIAQILEEKGVIANRYAALAYIFYSGNRHRLQAGEYLFDRPMTIPEVVEKLRTGSVYLHRFTVPEGFTVRRIAQKWQDDGFGTAADFTNAAHEAVEAVRVFDDKATSVEGYLFPETYSFPSRTTARQVVQSMIARFRSVVDRLQQTVPSVNWPLNLHDTVILASLVEAEAAHEEERPLIASVYWNRLHRRIPLQCDPTVIYALEEAGRYRGTLTLADLGFRSPYNTYTNPGLPPGPIGNPGYPSIAAAIQPAMTKYLFFVRTMESRHTFSENLAAHNRAVAAYRKSQKPRSRR